MPTLASVASASESFAGSLERYRDGAADIVELVQAQTTLAQVSPGGCVGLGS